MIFCAVQFFFESMEAETWMNEKKLQLLSKDYGKDGDATSVSRQAVLDHEISSHSNAAFNLISAQSLN